MLFNSPVFLFCFLPIALALHWLVPWRFRNFILLALSVVFYWWGGSSVIGILFFSMALNWVTGLFIGCLRDRVARVLAISFGVTANLLLLAYYKYFTLFLGLPVSDLPAGIIPLGISFYTFHSVSYLVDLYREIKKPFLNPIDFALYIALFPQLIAGPIVRFHDIADQIAHRSQTWDRLRSGCERFIFGLAKKVLLADSLGVVADDIFALSGPDLSTSHAWLGLVCFSLQIYYDFSGYSDMAIGLARLFGFELLENFNYPYLADSITDFWHRWHLSLSAWFRDYLYIPLGGNRCGNIAVYRNLLIVFLLCGLWHGPNWNFVAWGAYHGAFLILEKRLNLRALLPAFVRHVYALLVVGFGWVIFRTTNMAQAWLFLETLLGIESGSPYGAGVAILLDVEFYVALAAGLLLAFPVFTFLASDFRGRSFPNKATHLVGCPAWLISGLNGNPALLATVRALVCLLLFLLSCSQLATHTARSFIYFNF